MGFLRSGTGSLRWGTGFLRLGTGPLRLGPVGPVVARSLLIRCSHPSLCLAHTGPGLQSAGPSGSCPPAVSLHLCSLPPSVPFQALGSTVHPGPASVPSLVTRCWDWPATGLLPARGVHPEGARHPYESECSGQGLMPGAPRRIWEKPPGGYLEEAGFEPHLGQAEALW